MDFLYTFLIAFTMIFVSELGDKTQLIVLSFCNKLKASNILLGVALGTLFSHGLAILFGSRLGLINEGFRFYLSIFTYLTFILFGIFGFLHKENESITDSRLDDKRHRFRKHFSFLKLHYILMIAFSIFVGELGDKTFLASLGLGIEYPFFKFSLILGAIAGMVASNSFAILFGKFMGSKVKQEYIQTLSNLLFIVFGVVGFVKIFLNFY